MTSQPSSTPTTAPWMRLHAPTRSRNRPTRRLTVMIDIPNLRAIVWSFIPSRTACMTAISSCGGICKGAHIPSISVPLLTPCSRNLVMRATVAPPEVCQRLATQRTGHEGVSHHRCVYELWLSRGLSEQVWTRTRRMVPIPRCSHFERQSSAEMLRLADFIEVLAVRWRPPGAGQRRPEQKVCPTG